MSQFERGSSGPGSGFFATALTQSAVATRKFFRYNGGILVGLFLLAAFFSFNSNDFLTTSNMINVLRQISINAIIALGMTFVLLSSGIDLSVGSVVAATGSMMVSILVAFGVPIWIGIVGGLALGAALGLFNGFVIARGGLPPFIVTLAMLSMARGLAYVFTGGRPTRFDDPAFTFIGNGYIGPLPVPVVITILWFVICWLLLNRTRFGRHVYAIGGNLEAARFAGIKIRQVSTLVYVISGFAAGISGVILAARMSSGQPIAGEGFELDAIAAIVLGGTSLSGGRGRLSGTLIGALIIGLLNNGMNLLGVSFYYQLIIKGLVIITAVYIDAMSGTVSFERVRKTLGLGRRE
jgi:ribose transport system permease protein